MNHRLRIRAGALLLAVTGALVVPSDVAAAPPGWSGPAHVAGSDGIFNQWSATAPDGTDAVIWLGDGSVSGAALRAKVRAPGATLFTNVKTRIDNRASLQDLQIAATVQGDFFVTYVSYIGASPRTFAVKLNSRSKTWSKPTQVFKLPGYSAYGSSLAVAGSGTVVAGGYAKPDVDSSPPRYRAVVATLAPGAATWQVTFLSPATTFAGGTLVAAGPRGHLVAGFIRGYNLPEKTVYAATRAPSAAAKWKVKKLSIAGDSQRVSPPSVNGKGVVAMTWGSPSSSPTTVRLATTRVRPSGSVWNTTDLATGGGITGDWAAAVTKNGAATGLWREQTAGGTATIRARRVVGGTAGPLLTLSPAGYVSAPRSVAVRSDGRISVLWQQFTTSNANLGMRHTILAGDTVGIAEPLTDGTTEQENQGRLGLTADDQATVVYTRGYPPPDTDVAALGQIPLRPRATEGPFSRTRLTRAVVKGTMRVGRRVTCASGYWVETRSTAVVWRRDGRPIRGATEKSYRIAARDRGHAIYCRIVASNDVGTFGLTSKARTASQ
jgi:hypothetical protein